MNGPIVKGRLILRCGQQNADHGSPCALSKRPHDSQYAGCVAGILPHHVREHFPVIGTLETAKTDPAHQLRRQIFQAEGLAGSVASRINPTTNTISPRVDISGAEIVSAQRPACGAISTMPIGRGVNSSAETTGL